MANIPEYTRQEKIEATAQPLPFAQAARETGNVLASFGSDIAMKAAIGRSELAGIEAGTNPSGDLFPSLNKSDEAFNNGYRASAAATLTIAGDNLLNQSLSTVSQAPRLTPELLTTFHENMIKGIDEIVAQAPTTDKMALRANLTSQFLKTQTKLEYKMGQQQQEAIKENFLSYSQMTASDLFDSGSDQNAATFMFEDYKNNLEQMRESGRVTTREYDTLLKTARISLLTGREYVKMQDAIKNGDLDGFLSDFGKTAPDDMTFSEWSDVSKNLLSLVQLQDLTDSKNQSLLVSEGNLRRVTNSVDNESLLRFKEKMTPTNYNNFRANYFAAQKRKKDNQVDVQAVLDNWDNPGFLANADEKAISAAYEIQWKNIQATSGVDEFTAQTMAASTAAVPIMQYLNKLNAMARYKGSMEMALKGMQSLNDTSPGNLKGLSDDARNLLNTFANARLGLNEDDASEVAIKSIIDIDESKRKLHAEQWATKEKELFGKDGKLDVAISKASSLLGVKKSKMVDPLATMLDFKRRLKNNFIATGDMNVALKTTKDIMAASNGMTKVNGKEKYAYLPIERVMKANSDQMPFIYSQITEQVASQIPGFNTLIDKGQSDFKYEVSQTGIVSPEEYEQARAKLNTIQQDTNSYGQLLLSTLLLGSPTPTMQEVARLQETIGAFENPGRPVIKRVYKDGSSESFYLNIYAQEESDLYGDVPKYNVMLESMEGLVQEFIGANSYLGRNIIYVPDTQKFNDDFSNYLRLQSTDAAGMQAQQQFNDYLSKVKNKVDARRTMNEATQILKSTGKPMIPNIDGSVSTELSITVTDDRLNDGKPTNIPSIWNGKELSIGEAIQAAIDSGQKFESFDSIEEAVKAAQERSDMLGAEVDAMNQEE